MAEFFWLVAGGFLAVVAVGLIFAAASSTDDVKSAATTFLGAVVSALFAAYCLGYNVDVTLPYTYPLHTLGLLAGYVLLGLLYSFVRWLALTYRLSKARTSLWLYWLSTQFASRRRFIISDMIYKYCLNAYIDDPLVKSRLEDINTRLDCETLADLRNRVEAAGASIDVILKFEPAGITKAYFELLYNAEASNNPAEFLRSIGLAKLPSSWQSDWAKTLNNQSMVLREGLSTKLFGYIKPELSNCSSLIASWIVVWPACLAINTVMDAGQLCSTSASMLVDRLSGLYSRLANSVWREE